MDAQQRQSKRNLAHRLAVLGLGLYSGVMLTIGLGLGRYWLSLPPAEFVAWFTPNFWFLLPTIAATLPVALVGTVWSIRLADPGDGTWRKVLLLLVVTLVVTAAYHLPANIRIWSGELSDGRVANELTWWLCAHVVRVVAAIAAAWIGLGAMGAQAPARPAS
ncbi:MAG: hypothetical protein AAF799_01295 [Myxococcota bacterium]